MRNRPGKCQTFPENGGRGDDVELWLHDMLASHDNNRTRLSSLPLYSWFSHERGGEMRCICCSNCSDSRPTVGRVARTVVIPSWARACSPRTTWPGFLPQPPRRVYSTVSQEPGCDIMCSLPVSHTASQSFCIGQLLRCKWSQCTFNRFHGICRLSK